MGVSSTSSQGYLQAVDALLLQPHYTLGSELMRIGRDAERCEIILAREFVSRLRETIEVGGMELRGWEIPAGSAVKVTCKDHHRAVTAKLR